MKTYKSIASALSEPEKVKKLSLNNLEFKLFPGEILAMQNLEELAIEWSKLKSISHDIIQLSQLKKLDFYACTIGKIPPEIFLLPSLEQCSFREVSSKGIREKETLMKYICTNKPSFHNREAMVALLYENQPFISKCTFEQLAAALNVPVAIIQLAANKEIERRNGDLFQNKPPTVKSRIALLGKFKTGYNVLAGRLKSLGLEVGKKISDDTEFVVMGEKPGEINPEGKGLLIITENQLLSFLITRDSPSPIETGNNEITENLRSLLRSNDEGNQRIAFELINRHGLPEGMITDLFAHWVTSYDTMRNRAKKLLDTYGSPELKKLLTKPFYLKAANEVKLSTAIAEFNKKTEIDGIALSKILFSHNQQGRKYLLENGNVETRREIVQHMVKDNSISFSMLRLTRFPDEIFAFSNLKKLSLRTGKFDTIPEELGKLTDLEVLDLGATTQVKEFPETILKLKNLKYLSFSYTKYDLPESLKTLEKLECLELMYRDMQMLPAWLAELPSLKYLSIKGNFFSNEIHVPEVLFKMSSLEELSSHFYVNSDLVRATIVKAEVPRPNSFAKLQEVLPKTTFSSEENMIDRYFPLT